MAQPVPRFARTSAVRTAKIELSRKTCEFVRKGTNKNFSASSSSPSPSASSPPISSRSSPICDVQFPLIALLHDIVVLHKTGRSTLAVVLPVYYLWGCIWRRGDGGTRPIPSSCAHRADGVAARGRGLALLLGIHRECLDLEFCVAPDGVRCLLFLVFLVGPEVVCG